MGGLLMNLTIKIYSWKIKFAIDSRVSIALQVSVGLGWWSAAQAESVIHQNRVIIEFRAVPKAEVNHPSKYIRYRISHVYHPLNQ